MPFKKYGTKWPAEAWPALPTTCPDDMRSFNSGWCDTAPVASSFLLAGKYPRGLLLYHQSALLRLQKPSGGGSPSPPFFPSTKIMNWISWRTPAWCVFCACLSPSSAIPRWEDDWTGSKGAVIQVVGKPSRDGQAGRGCSTLLCLIHILYVSPSRLPHSSQAGLLLALTLCSV